MKAVLLPTPHATVLGVGTKRILSRARWRRDVVFVGTKHLALTQ